MESDGNVSDSDLIYVGEEHIDLDDHSTHASGIDELLIDQHLCGDGEIAYAEPENEDFDDNSCEAIFLNENRDEKDLSSGKVEGLMIVDEWDNEELNSEDEKEDSIEKDKDAMNPEDIEKSMLSMPTMKALMDDIGHLKHNRKVTVSPLSIEDFSAPQIQDILTWSALEETELDYIRSCKDFKALVGILVLHFTTSGSANKAVEALKVWREDLDIKVETVSNKTVKDFVSETRAKKRWTDNVAILKNLADDVKVESIKELFPQAEDVILHLDSSKHKEAGPSNSKDASSIGTGSVAGTSASAPRGYAYLVFPSEEAMSSEVSEAAAKKLEACGHRLLLLNYRNPVNTVPRSYLRLRERKVIMRHLDKCLKATEKAKNDPIAKKPERVEERIELCQSLIEKDNKCRNEMELPEPSLDELKRMSGLPAIDSVSCQKILVRFGIVKEKRKRTPSPQIDKRKDRGSNGNRVNPTNRNNTKKVLPSRSGRRSPYQNPRSRVPDSTYRNSRNPGGSSGRSMPPSLLGSATGIVNPLALMMQQNLGMMGSGGVMNPGFMMQPNVGMMGGGNSLLGPQNLPYVGVGSPMDDGNPKILRLDESGNFRTSEDVRQYSSRHDDRMRRNMDDSRMRDPMRRKRSGSPMSRSRQDYEMTSSKRSGMVDNVNAPANLLFNLSQMLSQNMEQKRYEVERGRRVSYDRGGYYRGSQR